MKRKADYILLIVFVILFSACGKKEPTWQEQYDLGMRYLNEKDYEEAVTAFQVAISIDPKQQPAYIGAADAYVGMAGSGEESIDVDKCYEAAEENYRKALDIDSETEAVYEKLADMYMEKEDPGKTKEVIEEAKKEGHEGTWEEEILTKLEEQKAQEEAASGEWKQAYLDYMAENRNYDSFGNDFTEYVLININNDGIPELYMSSGYTYTLCAYINGKLITQNMGLSGLDYLEGQNLFCAIGGHMDEYWDKVYKIEDGQFVMVADGEYGAEDNAHVQFDAYGEPIYQYYWNNEHLDSEATYKNQLNRVFDTSKAIDIYDGAEYDSVRGRYVGNGICDYDEMVEQINSYGMNE